jgi:hypothetical protein
MARFGLIQATKSEAVEMKRDDATAAFALKKPRQIPVWKVTDSDILDITEYGAPWGVVNMLDSTCLSSGSFQWTIAVERTISVLDSTILGVIQLSPLEVHLSPLETKSFICGFDQVGNFWDSRHVAIMPADRVEFRKAGTRVTIMLNLSHADVHNGSLWISVDGDKPVFVKGNLRCHPGGFVPAAKVAGISKLRIVDFQEIRRSEGAPGAKTPQNDAADGNETKQAEGNNPRLQSITTILEHQTNLMLGMETHLSFLQRRMDDIPTINDGTASLS